MQQRDLPVRDAVGGRRGRSTGAGGAPATDGEPHAVAVDRPAPSSSARSTYGRAPAAAVGVGTVTGTPSIQSIPESDGPGAAAAGSRPAASDPQARALQLDDQRRDVEAGSGERPSCRSDLTLSDLDRSLSEASCAHRRLTRSASSSGSISARRCPTRPSRSTRVGDRPRSRRRRRRSSADLREPDRPAPVYGSAAATSVDRWPGARRASPRRTGARAGPALQHHPGRPSARAAATARPGARALGRHELVDRAPRTPRPASERGLRSSAARRTASSGVGARPRRPAARRGPVGSTQRVDERADGARRLLVAVGSSRPGRAGPPRPATGRRAALGGAAPAAPVLHAHPCRRAWLHDASSTIVDRPAHRAAAPGERPDAEDRRRRPRRQRPHPRGAGRHLRGAGGQRRAMARAVCALRDAGWRVVLVHGNGPQVGNLAIQQEEAARPGARPSRCSALGAMTAGPARQPASAWRCARWATAAVDAGVGVGGHPRRRSTPTTPPSTTRPSRSARSSPRSEAEALAAERGLGGQARTPAAATGGSCRRRSRVGILETDAIRALLDAGHGRGRRRRRRGAGRAPDERGYRRRRRGDRQGLRRRSSWPPSLGAEALVLVTGVDAGACCDYGTPAAACRSTR